MTKTKILILSFCMLLTFCVPILSHTISVQAQAQVQALSVHAFETKTLYYSVDRFEGKYAVLVSDEGNVYNVLRSKLPRKVKEGDIFYKKGVKYIFSKTETEKRSAEIKKLLNELMK